MNATIVVLTEETLNEADARNLGYLAEDNAVRFEILVPADPGRHMLVDVLDNLSLLDFAAAYRNIAAPHLTAKQEVKAAEQELAESLDLLRGLGFDADGRVTGENPVEAVVEEARSSQAQQVVVITTPHAVEDTFGTDWANEAQDRLGVPVLHLYSGSTFIGDS